MWLLTLFFVWAVQGSNVTYMCKKTPQDFTCSAVCEEEKKKNESDVNMEATCECLRIHLQGIVQWKQVNVSAEDEEEKNEEK